MSDLVGNPEDRFSHKAAHIEEVYKVLIRLLLCCSHSKTITLLQYVFSVAKKGMAYGGSNGGVSTTHHNKMSMYFWTNSIHTFE